MNFNIELILWLTAFTAGFAASCDSVRLAHLSLQAVRRRHEPHDVIEDASHWRRDQILKTLFGASYLAVGIIGLFLPPQNPPPPTTLYGTVLTWILVLGGVLWGYTKVVDWLHTRHLWRRNANMVLGATDRELAASSEKQRSLAQMLNEAQLDSIAITGDETLNRVKRVEDAVVLTDVQAATTAAQVATTAAQAATTAAQTEERLAQLEDSQQEQKATARQTRRLVETGEDTNKIAHAINDKLEEPQK